MNHLGLPPAGSERALAPVPCVSERYSPAPLERQVHGGGAPGEDTSSNTLLDYWRILRRHKGTLVVAAFLGAVAGFALTLPQTPTYQASTSLEIQVLNENFMNMRDVNPTTGAPASPEIDLQTQVRILQSPSLVERVVDKLHLDGQPVVPARGRIDAWRQALGLAEPRPVSSREALLKAAAGNLKVRAQANTRIVEIFFDSSDPKFAAAFASTLAAEYIEQNLEARWKTTQHTSEWLGRQMQDLKAKLEKAEQEMQAYARTSGLLFTSEKENVAESKLRQVQEELSRAQYERIARQSKFELTTSSPAEALPDVLDNLTLKDYQGRIAELRRQLAELQSTLTTVHPRVVKVQAQIASLQSALEKERAFVVQRIRNDYETARRRESLLAASYAAQARLMAEQAAKITQYNMLKREVDTTRQMYDSVLQRVKEASVASALRASNVRIVDPAKAPAAPYKPNLPLNSSLGLVSGIFFGALFVILRERTDCSIQDPGETPAYLHASELGVIPSFDWDTDRKIARPRRAPERDASDGADGLAVISLGLLDNPPGPAPAKSTPTDPVLLCWRRKSSVVADSFRAAVTSLLLSGQNGDRPRVLVVSSANPDEGKTTVACNLAIALAELRRQVLLIDGDMRKPRLHEIFGLNNTAGLSEFLRDSRGPGLLAQPTGISRLYVIPSGSAGHMQLLYSPRLGDLLSQAREEADIVVIDTPPMLQLPDARVLGRCADGVILVVRAGQTSIETAVLARQRFSEDGTTVLGTILNDWNPKNTSAYGYGKSSKSYRRYYSE